MLVDARTDCTLPFQLRNLSTGAPVDADTAPVFRVIGQTGPAGDGTAALLEDGVITGATATSPSEITSAAHGLITGVVVTIASVGGVSGVNGVRQVTQTGSNTFTLDGTTGAGAYTSGGTWHTTGLYGLPFDSSIRDNLEPGQSYLVQVYSTVSGVDRVDTLEISVL